MNAIPTMISERAKAITETGPKGFLEWLKRYQPYHFREIQKRIPRSQLSGLGITAPTGDTTGAVNVSATPSWMNTIQNVILTASQAWMTKEQIDAQKKLLNYQIDRVKAGLSPLDIDPTTMGLPGPTARVGLTGDTQSLVKYGGIAALGLLGVYVLGKLIK